MGNVKKFSSDVEGYNCDGIRYFNIFFKPDAEARKNEAKAGNVEIKFLQLFKHGNSFGRPGFYENHYNPM